MTRRERCLVDKTMRVRRLYSNITQNAIRRTRWTQLQSGGQLVANFYYVWGFPFETILKQAQCSKRTVSGNGCGMNSCVTADAPSLNHASLLRVPYCNGAYCCRAVRYNYCGPLLHNVYSPLHVIISWAKNIHIRQKLRYCKADLFIYVQRPCRGSQVRPCLII